MTFRKGLINCSSALALLGAIVGIGNVAQAQDVRTEPRLRKAGDTVFSGSLNPVATSDTLRNVLQPWWPKDVHIPYQIQKDSLGRPLYGRVIPTSGGFVVSPLEGVENGFPVTVGVGIPSPFDGQVIIIGTTHKASSNKDWDKDRENDQDDQCPGDPEKIAPGKCGCGYIDTAGDTLCTDPEGAAPSTAGESENPEALRLLDMDVRGGKRQFKTFVQDIDADRGRLKVSVELSFALPRFASANDYVIEANEVLGENAFRSPEGDDAQTFFTADLAEEGDKVTYSCSLLKNISGTFKRVQLAKFRENNGRSVKDRVYAFPNAYVKLSKVNSTDEWRFRCVATNNNTGGSQEFFSRDFKLDFVKKKGTF